MPESWSGDDQWDDPIDLLLDGELYTKVTFQDGEMKKVINRTTALRNRLEKIVSFSRVDDDPGDSSFATGSGGAAGTTNFVNGTLLFTLDVKAGDVIKFYVMIRGLIHAPAASGAFRIGKATAGVVDYYVDGAYAECTSTTAVVITMRGSYVVPSDNAALAFYLLERVDNASGYLTTNQPRYYEAEIRRPFA